MLAKQALITFSLFCILSSSFAEAKQGNCSYFLEAHDRGKIFADTDRLISYLAYLYHDQILSLEALKKLAEEIKVQKRIVRNPVPHVVTKDTVTFSQLSHQIHYNNISAYLELDGMDYKKVLQWVLETLNGIEKGKVKKEEAEARTKVAITEMKFHRVEKGRLLINDDRKSYPVELAYDFEVMSTPITQWMWVKEMGQNPSRFKDGNGSLKIQIDSKEIVLQPDNPVENITWYSAVWFANELSKKHGLPEVYNFSKVKIKIGTSAAAGTLDIESGEVTINGGNIYETAGYRLPTEAEQVFLLTDRGRSRTRYFTDVTENNLEQYAWYQKNSDNRTHAVAQKRAYLIDGKDFYEFYGNVWEWSSDWVSENPLPAQNPAELNPADNIAMRGGSFGNFDFSIGYSVRGRRKPSWAYEAFGFRLVRTLK